MILNLASPLSGPDHALPVISLLTKAPRKSLVDDAFTPTILKVFNSVKEDLGE